MNVRKIFSLVIVSILSTSNIFALDYNWGEHIKGTIDGNNCVVASGTEDNNEEHLVYLYNEATGRFFNVGHWWGTHVVAKKIGIPFRIIDAGTGTYNDKEGKAYKIFTNEVHTEFGSYISYYTNNLSPRENSLFADRGENEGLNRFQFINANTEADEAAGKHYYYIKGFSSISSISSSWSKPFYITVTDEGDEVEKLLGHEPNNIDKVKDDPRAKWLLVTLKDLKERINTQYTDARYDDPADATFFIQDQGITRSLLEPSGKLKGTKSFWNETTNGLIQTGNDDSYGKQNSSAHSENGKYWHAFTKGKSGKVYQKFTVTKPGWYRVTCDGFYHKDNTYAAYLYANGTLTELRRIDDDTYKGFKDNWKPGNNLIVNEGIALYSGDYKNDALVYIEPNNLKLELGIRIDGSNLSEDDRVTFDNFKLEYLCLHAIILDETKHGENYNAESAGKDYGQTLILKRTFKTSKYNTFCLPVDLTKAQLQGAFGKDVQLATLAGVLSNPKQRIIQFKKVDLDAVEDNDVVLEKEQFYLMKLSYAGSKETANQNQRFYVINNAYLDAPVDTTNYHREASSHSTADNSFFKDEDEAFISFRGTFINLDGNLEEANNAYINRLEGSCKERVVWGPSYILNDGTGDDKDKGYGFYRWYQPRRLMGFRCWIHQAGAKAEQGQSKLFFGFADENNIVSSIDDLEDSPVKVTNRSNKIYNIAGQEVKSDYKGIIIQNGKKYCNK